MVTSFLQTLVGIDSETATSLETGDSCMITIDAVGTRDPHMVFLEICVVASFIGESFRWNTAHFDYLSQLTN